MHLGSGFLFGAKGEATGPYLISVMVVKAEGPDLALSVQETLLRGLQKQDHQAVFRFGDGGASTVAQDYNVRGGDPVVDHSYYLIAT